MPMYNYECTKCTHTFEEISKKEKKIEQCPKCNANASRIAHMARTLTSIIPAYPGCKKQKAGYVHTHKDRPSTKIQSGYGGCSSPKN